MKTKSRIHPWVFWQGIVLMLISVATEWGASVAFRVKGITGGYFIFAMLLISVVTTLIFGFGIVRLRYYFRVRFDKDSLLNRFSFDEVNEHLTLCTQHTYKNYKTPQIYFTNCMIVIPRYRMIAYREISMMYWQMRETKLGTEYDLVIHQLNGWKYVLCQSSNREDILGIIRICYQYNPKILCENTKYNRDTHKERVTLYKNGQLSPGKIDLRWANREGKGKTNRVVLSEESANRGVPTPYKWTEQGEKQQRHLKLKSSGMGIAISSVVMAIFLAIIIEVISPSHAVGAAAAEAEQAKRFVWLVIGVSTLPITITGIVLYFIGKHKTKER